LSPKAKSKTKAKKAEVPEAPKETRPTGRVPAAMVSARHEGGMVNRGAKGFSLGEMSRAGLPPRLAAKWGVPSDIRRRSVLDENVRSLGKWYTPPVKKAPKPAPAKEPEPVAPVPVKKPAKKRAARKKKED
jgi:ribosomal protein L13E